MRRKLVLLSLLLHLTKMLYAQDVVADKEKLLDFYQSQRYVEAAKYLQSVYPNHIKDVKILGQVAYCQLMGGQLSNAEQSYVAIRNIDPINKNALFNLASINAKRGNSLKAKFYLEEILKLDSTNFNALKQLANFTDSVPLKIILLKKANDIQPTDADVASDLATMLRSKKMIEPAYQVLKIAIAADSGNFILQQELLPNAIDLKKYDEVVVMGEKLLLVDKDINVLKDVGKAYYFLKNYQKCLSNYQIIEEMGRQNEMLLYYMTLCYRELKNYEMAAIYAKKTIDEAISPNTATYYAMLGAIYELNNKLNSSDNAYKKGLTFNKNSNLYYRLALLNDLKLKKPVAALNYYHAYLKSKPDEKMEKEQIEYVSNRILMLKKK